MKKILSIIFCLLLSCNCVFAGITDALYELSAQSPQVSSNVQGFLNKNHYDYAVLYSSGDKTDFYLKAPIASDYGVIRVFAKDNKAYLYILNNSKSLDCQDVLVKQLGFKSKKIGDKNLLADLREEALVTKNNFDRKNLQTTQKPTYDFSDEAQQKHDADQKAQTVMPVQIYNAEVEKTKKQKAFVSSQVKPINNPPVPVYKSDSSAKSLKGSITCVPSGAVLDAALQSTIDSASLQQDDKITASLNSDFLYKGLLIAPKGSIVYGKASQVVHPGYAYGNGELKLTFYQILTPKGSQINIATEKITVSQKSKRAISMTRNVLVGAGLGALGGLLMGDATYAARGAIIGATAGGVRAVAHKGENVSVKSGLPLQIKLAQPINISVYD